MVKVEVCMVPPRFWFPQLLPRDEKQQSSRVELAEGDLCSLLCISPRD
jgi:hypothetical protein